MKRCPQCDFLYEEEQSLCDMDGSQLVADTASLSNETLVASPIATKRKSSWKLFGLLAVPAMALGIIIPVALQSGRAVEQRTSESVAPNANQVDAPATVAPFQEPASSPSPSPEPTAEETPGKISSDAQRAANSKLEAVAKQSANSVVRANSRAIGSARAKSGGLQLVVVSSNRSGEFVTQPVPPRPRTSPKPQVSTAKSNNGPTDKIGSLLKRTGRILKKPFKF